MKQKRILNALTMVDEVFIEEAAPGTGTAAGLGRRVLAVVLAAVLALFLMGAGVATGIFGNSIQDWFDYYWNAITGQSMDKSQSAVIDNLSQEIGLSQTVGDITVTVDSATVGDDNFFLLLKVEGMRFSKRYGYTFGQNHMTVSPDPLEGGGGLGGYGLEYHGLDGDGAIVLMMDYEYAAMTGYVEDISPLEVTLELKDLFRDGSKRKLLAEGEWYFTFTLDRSDLPEPVRLPDSEVMGMELEQNTRVPLLLTDIELTNTGMRFCYDCQGGTLALSPDFFVVLKNGLKVECTGGTGTLLDGGPLLFCSYQWMFPVDLEDVAAIQIGSTQIPVP